MSDIHFQGIWRMDWGLGNPNKTAALIAILMIAVWGLAFLKKGEGRSNIGFWIALLPFTALGICLIHTLSRGGIVALFAGLIPLVVTAPRSWPRSKLLALGAVAWIIIGATIFLNAHLRYEQGFIHEDRSITNRFQIWKAAPLMMVDAPGGWGLGNSGSAYMEWYQPLTKNEGYRTLVNSHLTWLVEMGWLLRLAYIFGWGSIFLICWPGRDTRWFAVPLGIWIAFAVAASFSSVAESPWLWIIPGASLLAVIGYRGFTWDWFPSLSWLIPLATSVMLCGLLYCVGLMHPSGIHRQRNAILVGSSAPQVWLLPDEKVLGKNLGRAIRIAEGKVASATDPLSVGVILDPAHLPSLQGKRVIVVGNPIPHEQVERVFKEASAIQLVNPGYFPEEIGLTSTYQVHTPINLWVGEFAQTPTSMAWKEIVPTHLIAGVGDYIPDWSPILHNDAGGSVKKTKMAQ